MSELPNLPDHYILRFAQLQLGSRGLHELISRIALRPGKEHEQQSDPIFIVRAVERLTEDESSFWLWQFPLPPSKKESPDLAAIEEALVRRPDKWAATEPSGVIHSCHLREKKVGQRRFSILHYETFELAETLDLMFKPEIDAEDGRPTLASLFHLPETRRR